MINISIDLIGMINFDLKLPKAIAFILLIIYLEIKNNKFKTEVEAVIIAFDILYC
jgi:hypothetical protein